MKRLDLARYLESLSQQTLFKMLHLCQLQQERKGTSIFSTDLKHSLVEQELLMFIWLCAEQEEQGLRLVNEQEEQDII